MELVFSCHECQKESRFESASAERVYEKGTGGAIYKVFCLYCGAENQVLLDTPPVETDPFVSGR